jgi:Fe2+ or Zn2+ uptake regulation protein
MRTGGLRITRPRLAVIRALEGAESALSPNSLHSRIRAEGQKIDLVSVYRILSALVELGLVHRIGSADGYRACTLGGDHSAHGQHLVCSSCLRTLESSISDAVVSEGLRAAKEAGYASGAVQVEIIAVCPKCQASPAD